MFCFKKTIPYHNSVFVYYIVTKKRENLSKKDFFRDIFC